MGQGRVQQDCQDTPASNFCCSASKFCKVLLGLTSLIWIGLSVAEIVIGSVYLHQCDFVQRYIPIYLIVNGVTVIVMSLLAFVAGLKPNKVIYALLGLLSLFWFAWLIAGSIWTFPHYYTYSPSCHETVYLFTFSILIIQWIVLAFSLPVLIIKLYSLCSSCSSCSFCSSWSSCSMCSRCLSCCSCMTKH